MTEASVENQLKYENYKEQFKRLNRALANGFTMVHILSAVTGVRNISIITRNFLFLKDRNRSSEKSKN